MKKVNYFLTFTMIIVICILTSCEQNKKFVEKAGLLKCYNLHRTKNMDGVNGKIGGSFFLGCGSVDGKLSSERQLQFEWGRNSNERIITTLAYNKFLFVFDSTKIVPTIEFVFGKEYLKDQKFSGDYNLNPNSYLLNEGFEQAIVKISRKDYEEEVYLQK